MGMDRITMMLTDSQNIKVLFQLSSKVAVFLHLLSFAC
jgi:hypothetical protein